MPGTVGKARDDRAQTAIASKTEHHASAFARRVRDWRYFNIGRELVEGLKASPISVNIGAVLM